jgi:nucleolin
MYSNLFSSFAQSHFAGNTVPVNGESGGILYTRYTDPGELLLVRIRFSQHAASADYIIIVNFLILCAFIIYLQDGEKPVNDAPVEKKERKRKVKEAPETAAAAPAPAAPATVATAAPTLNFGGTEAPPDAVPVVGDDVSGEQSKVRKKARWTDEQKAAAKEEKAAARKAAGLPEKPTAAEKKKKKDKQKEEPLMIRKLAPEDRISGPGNAEEATKIRETLGFIAPPATTAAAPVAAAGGGGGFAFGFQAEANANEIKSEDSSSDEEEDEKKPIVAPPAAAVPAAATPAFVAVKEEEDDDSSSSSSDEEDEKLTKKEEEESSDDDISSSSSDSDDSSSSGDDEAPAATTVAAPATNANGALVSPLYSEFVPRRVYVGGMPYTFSEAQVAEFWEYCGAIESLDLLTFPDTGRFRGIAFITFATEEGYTAALACDGEACEGQTVKVQKCKWSAKDRRAALMGQQGGDGGGQTEAVQGGGGGGGGMNAAAVPPPPSYAGAAGVQDNAPGGVSYIAPPTLRPPAPKTTGYDVAYVGNIAYEADEAAVRALFEPFGVTKVRLHTDKDTGKPKGFAHVHFKDEPSLDSAMSLNGTQLMGRRIKVGYAQPKKEAPPAT